MFITHEAPQKSFLKKVGEKVPIAGMTVGMFLVSVFTRHAGSQQTYEEYARYYGVESSADSSESDLFDSAEEHEERKHIFDSISLLGFGLVLGGAALGSYQDNKRRAKLKEEWQQVDSLRDTLTDHDRRFYKLVSELEQMAIEARDADSRFGSVNGYYFASEISRVLDTAVRPANTGITAPVNIRS